MADLEAFWLGNSGTSASPFLDAARELDKFLGLLSRAGTVADRMKPFLDPSRAGVLLGWCRASATRSDVRLHGFLQVLCEMEGLRDAAMKVLRARIVKGPLQDALSSATVLGTLSDLAHEDNRHARTRLEILLWEAGGTSIDAPEFGRFVWSSRAHFEEFVLRPAKGALRERVLAARTIELAARHFDQARAFGLLDDALRVLQPLVLHPELLVSVPASRAVGVLAGRVDHLDAMLLDWLHGPAQILRERAVTALGSLPAPRIRALKGEFFGALDREGGRKELLFAAAAATPYLFFEAREVWDALFARVVGAADEGAPAMREMARTLGGAFRSEAHQGSTRGPLRTLRQLGRRAVPESLAAARDWLLVISSTDPLEGAERDPIDLETGLGNLIRLAAQYEDEEADARAARFAGSVGRVFDEAHVLAVESSNVRDRASGLNGLVGAARSLALRLWHPQVRGRALAGLIQEPSVSAAWERISRAPSDLLDRARGDGEEDPSDVAESEYRESLAIVALEVAGYSLDACVEESGLAGAQGSQAHAICRWLIKLEGTSGGTQGFSDPLQRALSSLFWRLVDTTRGTALGAVDDVEWLGPFATWWALVIEKPGMLIQLANALPMIRHEALERCATLAGELRETLAQDSGGSGAFLRQATRTLKELFADQTELGASLLGLGRILERMSATSGRDVDLEGKCEALVLAAERVWGALSNPVRGLHRAHDGPEPRSDGEAHASALVVRAIRGRELGLLDVWLASLGPVVSALVEAAVSGAVERTPPPPPSRQKLKPEMIEGYELVRPLGEGGVGKVWLVRKPGADRLFVLKIPKKEALQNASDTERQGLLASFVEEARALASLYHPNVANIIDRGVSGDVPFLVLELLIGADLYQYCQARLLTLSEIRPIVLDVCAGLAALHGANLVHRDIKPANVWLRLPLERGVAFLAEKHRDPTIMRPLSAVVIDFGMVRPTKVAKEASGKFVAGTPGFIAPDQVLDPVELDGRADVYALAATIYAATMGRTFFDDLKNPRDRIFAHMQRDPLEDPSLIRDYPPGLAKLMRSAVALDPKDRPHPIEFARAFETAL